MKHRIIKLSYNDIVRYLMFLLVVLTRKYRATNKIITVVGCQQPYLV